MLTSRITVKELLAQGFQVVDERNALAGNNLIDDDFLAREFAGLVQAREAANEVEPCVGVEYSRVVNSLLGQEDSQRQQHCRTQPDALPHWPAAIAGQLVAHVVDDVINNEQDDRDDDGHSQASLADDGAKGRADEEKDETRQREREFLHQLDLVTADDIVVVIDGIALELHVLHRRGRAHQGLIDDLLLFVVGQFLDDLVIVNGLVEVHFLDGLLKMACRP